MSEVRRHAHGWHQAVAACLISFLAALTVTTIMVHNAANAGERHHAAVRPDQRGAGNHVVDSIARLAAAALSVKGVAFSPAGKLVAGAYSDGTIWLWDTAAGQSRALALPASAAVSANSVAFSPDGKLVAGAYSDGTIRLWDTAVGTATRSFPRPGPVARETADGIAFRPDGKLLAGAYGDGTVWQWNPGTGQRALLTVPSAASAGAVAFSPDGKLVASAYSDGTIRLWNPSTGRGVVLTVSSAVSAGAVAFSPDGKLLASVYSDGTIRLWNPSTGRLARSPLQMHAGGLEKENGVAFSPDGSLLASADGNGTLRLWHLGPSRHGGLADGGWLVTTAAVITIVLAGLAAVITTREIRLTNRRRPSAGRQLWRSCCS